MVSNDLSDVEARIEASVESASRLAPSSRAGGEQSTHGDAAGPEDLVCAPPPRGGGDFRGGVSLMAERTRFEPFHLLTNLSIGLEKERNNLKSDDCLPPCLKPIRGEKNRFGKGKGDEGSFTRCRFHSPVG